VQGIYAHFVQDMQRISLAQDFILECVGRNPVVGLPTISENCGTVMK
jgi:hypothetical protein